FIMSENASTDILHKLLHSSHVQIFDFKQATAYARKIENLNKLDLPEGGIDFGLNIPSHDISLLGPTVELIANKNLHPAFSDLLLEAAQEVHSKPGLFHRRGEFPAPYGHVIPISKEAARFYKDGRSLLYRFLPFWLASLLSRFAVAFIPIFVVVYPA